MHTFVDRFYLNDKSKDNRFTPFGAFPSMSNSSIFQNTLNKTSMPTINPGTHEPFLVTQPQPLNRMIQPAGMTRKSPFVDTGRSLFLQSTSDLINNQIPRHTKEFYKTNQEIALEDKKNSTKLQLMEEKMRSLELKSQRLEVINDFFFDMFENNLVKEELKKNQLEEAQRPNEYEDDYQDNSYDEYEEYDKRDPHQKKKKKRKRKARRETNEPMPTTESPKMPNLALARDQTGVNPEKDFDAKAFQQKTLKNATKVMKNLKKSVSDYILEEQLKKNEEMQSITEEIFEIKSDLQNKIRRLQEKQRIQMEGLAYVLQNAGNPKIEALAQRILNNQYYDFNTDNNILNSPKKEGQFEDNASIASMNRKASLIGSGKHIRRQSIQKKSPFKVSQVGMISEEAEFSPKDRRVNEFSPIEAHIPSVKKSPKKVSPRKSQSPAKSKRRSSLG